jgi:aminoglycoside phosphotransferase family enzyme
MSSGCRVLQHAAEYVARSVEGFIFCRKDLLLRRLDSGRVVEGHGDLRPEHICLSSMPRIIDCLEFRADLRFVDPLDELAFLAMECERLGVRSVEPILLRRYCSRTHDFAPSS